MARSACARVTADTGSAKRQGTNAVPRLGCRQLAESDIEDAIVLLARGFPERIPAYWRQALSRLRTRACPQDYPRYGYVLTENEQLVGIVLLIVSAGPDGAVRANVSSWYVEPDFRSYSNVLLSRLFRLPGVTVVNISPAPNTSETIRAQGYVRYGADGLIVPAALGLPRPGATLRRVFADTPDASPLLRDHAAWDCLCYEVWEGSARTDFVFARHRIASDRVPCAQLIHASDMSRLSRYIGPLGRALLGQGLPLVLLDAERRVPGLFGLRRRDRNLRFARGPNPPPVGDLSYTEMAVFGC